MRFFEKLFRRSNAPRATLQQIRGSFDQAAKDEEHFPSTIDPRIYHVQLLQTWLGELEGKRVVDLGSGKGRFARVLLESSPRVSLCAFDLSEAMLRYVPDGIARCCGSMTALPFRSETVDAAYATESLEHVIDIDTAIAEMCRIVKPGGRIFIIDKNAEHWGRLKTPAWEKWFHRGELETLLKRDCRHVESRHISYWDDVPPDGLFLAWMAER